MKKTNIIQRALFEVNIRLTTFAYALMHWRASRRTWKEMFSHQPETTLVLDYADRYFMYTAEVDGLALRHWPGKDDGVPPPLECQNRSEEDG